MLPSLTIVTGCKDRVNNLLSVLPSWLFFVPHIVQRIVIIDWETKTELALNPEIKKVISEHDHLVTVIRVENVKSWKLSACLNFASRFVTSLTLLKLDCDYKLHPGFFKAHIIQKECFFHGNYKLARDSNETHLNGVLYCWLDQFLRVGGYNEYIQDYGFDDSDLYNRLVKQGFKARYIDFDYVSHISHGDELRVDEPKLLNLKILFNMFLSEKKPWTSTVPKSKYREVKPKIYEMQEAVKIESDLVAKCLVLAQRCLLNDKYQISWNVTNNKNPEFVASIFQQKEQPKLILEPLNGLANRLRAIASAAVVSRKLNFIFLIYWKADIHCDCKFDDLFDAKNLLVSATEFPWYKNSSPSNILTIPISSFTEKFMYTIPCNGWVDEDLLPKIKSFDAVYYRTACILPSSLTSYREECNWLKDNLKIVPHLSKKIEEFSLKWNLPECIGIHIRRGQPDKQFQYESSDNWNPQQREKLRKARSESHFWFFMQEIERLWAVNPQQKFFLCADRESTYQAFRQSYPEKANEILYITRTVYDRSLLQLESALFDVVCLSRCKEILGSPWSSFTEVAARLRYGIPLKVSGKDFNTFAFGTFQYTNSCNVGDNIQSLITKTFLPNSMIPYLVDRDHPNSLVTVDPPPRWDNYMTLEQLDAKFPISATKWQDLFPVPPTQRVKIICSGWFDGRWIDPFPYPSYIFPLFISVHINEDVKLLKNQEYQILVDTAQSKRSLFDSKQKIDYWHAHAPIGCRDDHTLRLFEKHKIKAYLSSCLTLSFRPKSNICRTSKIYIVDVHLQYPNLLKKFVPQTILDQAIYKTHIVKGTHIEKEKVANELLTIYQSSKYVITSRIHCALVCLAFDTPVLFLYGLCKEDVRFQYDSIMTKLLGHGDRIPSWWNFDKPKVAPWQKSIIENFRKIQSTRIKEFLASS